MSCDSGEAETRDKVRTRRPDDIMIQDEAVIHKAIIKNPFQINSGSRRRMFGNDVKLPIKEEEEGPPAPGNVDRSQGIDDKVSILNKDESNVTSFVDSPLRLSARRFHHEQLNCESNRFSLKELALSADLPRGHFLEKQYSKPVSFKDFQSVHSSLQQLKVNESLSDSRLESVEEPVAVSTKKKGDKVLHNDIAEFIGQYNRQLRPLSLVRHLQTTTSAGDVVKEFKRGIIQRIRK